MEIEPQDSIHLRPQTYVVYHKINPSFRVEGTEYSIEDFEKVAIVTCYSLSEVFEYTNHIDGYWWYNGEVAMVKESRSTSVGDLVYHQEWDRWYVCAPVGWSMVNVH